MIALLLLLLVPTSPEAADSLRQRGDRLLAERDTAGAIAAYEASVSGPWERAEVWASLGRLHLARRDAGEALAAAERTARLAPTRQDASALRADAYALAGQRATPPSFWTTVSRRSVAVVGLTGVIAGALAVYLAVAGLGLAWHRTRRRHVGWAALVGAPLAIIAVLLAATVLWDIPRKEAVTTSAVEVRSRPTPEAPVVGRLGDASVVHTAPPAAGWRWVSGGDVEGWVPASSLADV